MGPKPTILFWLRKGDVTFTSHYLQSKKKTDFAKIESENKPLVVGQAWEIAVCAH
jgi:hypothetical protein